jgi:hypothetical protein
MSARRRRAALSAVGAVLAALICAVLASSVDSSAHRAVLIVLALAWLVIAGSCIAGLLRTEGPPTVPDTGETSLTEPHTGEAGTSMGGSDLLDERPSVTDDPA